MDISSSLACSVRITLSELATGKHVNPCTAARAITAQVLDTCATALTTADVTKFIDMAGAGKPGEKNG